MCTVCVSLLRDNDQNDVSMPRSMQVMFIGAEEELLYITYTIKTSTVDE